MPLPAAAVWNASTGLPSAPLAPRTSTAAARPSRSSARAAVPPARRTASSVSLPRWPRPTANTSASPSCRAYSHVAAPRCLYLSRSGKANGSPS
ncbi:hypothetical protein M3216_31865 [Paenibacillus macerans]|nr:hypothetical protein [Paenibacillus macerans]MCM3703965.1 hypothetical protein [Paenibacillus macerans]